ncbi:MAG: UvrD-helicase domain-containing protein, partial [Fibrella sp.]|nr:UvrD-helicase domain-containing protein [Armatimonadota bacterium]
MILPTPTDADDPFAEYDNTLAPPRNSDSDPTPGIAPPSADFDPEDPLLVRLNPSQQEAVLHKDGPLLIFAGAGSGKTRVLTHRIAYLVGRHGIRPRNILAVTFTNKAATEMKERLQRLLGLEATKEMWVGTFHATCARMLRERGKDIGLEREFTVYDDGDQITLMKECLSQLNLDDRQYAPRAVLSLISKAKEKLIEPENFGHHFHGVFEGVVSKLYTLYQEKLKQNRAVDFDDLIMLSVRLLEQREDTREYYQNKFRYVLVDEYQDINNAQY